jgi:hypothetical protein
MKPTVGRIVEYTTADRNGKKVVRPAMVVAVWSETCINLQVFTDGYNDNDYGVNTVWKTSVMSDENKNHNTWDWMTYQKEQALKAEGSK